MLAACGGGGSSGTATSTQTSPATGTPVTPPVTPPATSGTPPVADSNQAPTISGTAPATVTAGQSYSFKPSASDPDQDKVTFTIANKPSWAAFDASTGALTGTPAAADVGAHSGIEIAATDGDSVASLPAFTITVVAALATNGVEVSWSPPTQNDDGSTLTDLSGYKIHYGTQSGNYTDSVAVENAGLTRYSLASLPKGTVFIALTAVNSAGAESDFSKEVSVKVN